MLCMFSDDWARARARQMTRAPLRLIQSNSRFTPRGGGRLLLRNVAYLISRSPRRAALVTEVEYVVSRSDGRGGVKSLMTTVV